jgi:hypothetical protein
MNHAAGAARKPALKHSPIVMQIKRDNGGAPPLRLHQYEAHRHRQSTDEVSKTDNPP